MKNTDRHWKWIAGFLLICLVPSVVFAEATGIAVFNRCMTTPSTVIDPSTNLPWSIANVLNCQNCTEYDCQQQNDGNSPAEVIARKRCVEISDALCIEHFGGGQE